MDNTDNSNEQEASMNVEHWQDTNGTNSDQNSGLPRVSEFFWRMLGERLGSYTGSNNERRNKPEFIFPYTKYINFDLEKNNFSFICDLIRQFKGYNFDFQITHGKYYAMGKGANKQIYNKLCSELIYSTDNQIMIQFDKHVHFMDINLNNTFWDAEDNIKCFVIFVAMTINAGCVLPFHFVPALLEAIANKKLTLSDLEFYMELIDPESLKFAKKIDSTDFKSLDSDFDTHENFYRSIVIGSITEKQKNIYKSISNYFELFDAFNKFDIRTVDDTFSGLYLITADMVVPLFHFMDEEYLPLWKQFVYSLSEKEIRQMLIAFGNTLSLNDSFFVHVEKDYQMDIKIQTCFHKIYINEKLFEKVEYLDGLKCYFNDCDQISDGRNDYDASLLNYQSPLYSDFDGDDISNYNNDIYIPITSGVHGDDSVQLGNQESEENYFMQLINRVRAIEPRNNGSEQINAIENPQNMFRTMISASNFIFPRSNITRVAVDTYNDYIQSYMHQYFGRAFRPLTHRHNIQFSHSTPDSDRVGIVKDIILPPLYVIIPPISEPAENRPISNQQWKSRDNNIKQKNKKNTNANSLRRNNNNIRYARNNRSSHKKNYR